MTTSNLFYRIKGIAILLCVAIIAVSCDRASLPTQPSSDRKVSIAYLKSLANGRIYDIREDFTISGIVVANDWLGEYVSSIVVVDDTAGLEVEIDGRGLYIDIPIFSEVTIFCNGMTLAMIGGKVALGAHPTGEFPLDGLSRELISTYIRIDATGGTRINPIEKTFDEISINDISSYTLFRNATIVPEEVGKSWCDIVDGNAVATMRHVLDKNGVMFGIRTLPTTIYAYEPVPEGVFDVIGIIDYSGNEYYLRIVNGSIIEH